MKCMLKFAIHNLDPGKSLGPSGKFEFWDWNEDGQIEMKDVSTNMFVDYFSFSIFSK